MSPRSSYPPLDRKSWLLAIGSRLRAEYDAVAEPVPERLAALLAQLDAPVADSTDAVAATSSEAVLQSSGNATECKPAAAPLPSSARPLRDCRATI